MKTRIRLFWLYYTRGYCVCSTWREAERKQRFERRRQHGLL